MLKSQIGHGVPTRADVEQLMKAFGLPAAGVVITYAEVEEAGHIRYGTDRWRTVTDAWRKRLLREHRIMLVCENKSFLVADDDRKSVCSSSKFKTGVRSLARSRVIDSVYTDRDKLTAQNQKAYDHRMMTTATMLQHERDLRRRTLPDMPKPHTPAVSPSDHR